LLVSGKDSRSQYKAHWPDHDMQILRSNLDEVFVNMLCSADLSLKSESQVFLHASSGHLIHKIQHSTTRQEKQKISAKLDHHWSKKYSFLCVQTN